MAGRRLHPALVVIRACALIALAFSVMTAVEYYGRGGTFCAEAGDCVRVRALAGGIAVVLPALGVLAYTTLFALTLPKGRGFARAASTLAVLGMLVGAYLVYLQWGLDAWCWLCTVIDSSAIVAGVAGLRLLISTPADEDGLGSGFVTYWWAPFWVAVFVPIVYGTTVRDDPLPAEILALYQDGKVNIVELSDFECPYCRAMHPVLRQAIEQSGENVRLLRLTYPLSFHERARPAARAYYCAVEQAKGEPMADLLFEGELSDEALRSAAETLELDMEAFDGCLAHERSDARVQRDVELVDRFGMRGLPMVFIGPRTHRGFAPGSGPEVFAPSIEAAAAGETRRIRYWPALALLALLGLSLVVPYRSQRASGLPK